MEELESDGRIIPLGFTRPCRGPDHGLPTQFVHCGSLVGLFCDCERKLERALDGVRLIRTYEWGVVKGAVVVRWERRSV